MSCLSPTRRAELTSQLARWQARLTTLNNALDSMIDGGIESYKFDSGEGSQQTKYQDPDKLNKQIEIVEAKIDLINRKLRGTGIVTMNLRRH